MVATAEKDQTQIFRDQTEGLDFSLPDVLIVPEMYTDEAIRVRAARFIGAAVLDTHESIEVATTYPPIESLHEAIHRAAVGDEVAGALVETNIATDVVERTIKTGHVMKPVPLLISDAGKILQHGQYMDSVQANSLRYAADHPIMRARTEAETRNSFRIEELNRAGFFENYSFMVISRAENLPDAGFFTDTMSFSIQVTTKRGDGLETESAFVSGISAPGKAQHDERTVIELGKRLEVDLTNKTPAEIIDTPLLIHNDFIPNGAIDIVRLSDECSDTFFGEDKPKQDYLDYRDQCRKREQAFIPKIMKIKAELLAEAGNIQTPIQAVEKLHELSEKHMVEHAVQDKTVNPEVFGLVAAGHIEVARWHIAQGNEQEAKVEISAAQDTAQSNSCPSKIKTSVNEDGPESENPNATSEDGDCEFISKKCPECGASNVKTVVRKNKLTNKKTISGSCGCSITVK